MTSPSRRPTGGGKGITLSVCERVSLLRMVSQGSMFSARVVSISRCWGIVSILSLWLPLKEKKKEQTINVKLEVSHRAEVVRSQLCGNIFTLR